jgi:hypothetical protein
MKWEGHVAGVGIREVLTEILWGNLRGKDYLEDLGVDARIILKSIFKNWDGGIDWIDLAQYRHRL